MPEIVRNSGFRHILCLLSFNFRELKNHQQTCILLFNAFKFDSFILRRSHGRSHSVPASE
nr:MAG TPA: hypothetical protein [Bacteriophage sp.]